MGITKLSALIQQNCKSGYRKRSKTFYHGRKVAIDTSMYLYQFLIAIRADGTSLGTTDSTTSHLVGIFYRTIKMVENGIRPIYIFDGKAPFEKINELEKRKKRRDLADEKFLEAKEAGNEIEMEKYEKRKIKVTAKHVEDVKKLLNLMAVPVFVAPSEAEAYCAFLGANKIVDAVITEDMDTLAFGAPLLLRNMNNNKKGNELVDEYNLNGILKDLDLNMDEFVDLCILLGCDFCKTIKGVGPKTALSLIKEFKSIEEIKKNKPNLDFPLNWSYEEARLIFKNLNFDSKIVDGEIKWNDVDVEGIKQFLVNEADFSEERVVKAIERYLKCKKRGIQGRLEMFLKK